jgi:hypothetical protein
MSDILLYGHHILMLVRVVHHYVSSVLFLHLGKLMMILESTRGLLFKLIVTIVNSLHLIIFNIICVLVEAYKRAHVHLLLILLHSKINLVMIILHCDCPTHIE